jgi:3-oxoacyl-[acyl-carrier-protein] synthase-1
MGNRIRKYSFYSYLNNLGIVNALGATKNEVAANLLKNGQSNMVVYSELFSGRKTIVGKVSSNLKDIPQQLAKYNCRNNQLIATAYAGIADNVEFLKQKYGPDRIGIILGTSTSGIASGEVAFKEYMKNKQFPVAFDYTQQEVGSCSEFLAKYAGLTGINYTISTACSSSAKAVAAGDRLIKTNCCDAVIVGGSDSLCELTLNGFDCLELLSSTICNPFSVNRSGLNIGEGAALFILSKESAPIKLIASGESSDGYHATSPDPKGSGAKLAINEALQAAQLNPSDIGYINLHGTGTLQNDAMESLVIHDLFSNAPLCSSTKPLIGHTLGAAGAQELGLCWLLLSEYNADRLLPSQIWDHCKDANIGDINLIAETTKWTKPRFMSLSFAFGGSNACLIIEKT